jgi:hypothetical protein
MEKLPIPAKRQRHAGERKDPGWNLSRRLVRLIQPNSINHSPRLNSAIGNTTRDGSLATYLASPKGAAHFQIRRDGAMSDEAIDAPDGTDKKTSETASAAICIGEIYVVRIDRKRDRFPELVDHLQGRYRGNQQLVPRCIIHGCTSVLQPRTTQCVGYPHIRWRASVFLHRFFRDDVRGLILKGC